MKEGISMPNKGEVNKRVLISFIGKGNYKEAKYSYEGQEKTTKYIPQLLRDILAPDKVIIIGTKDSAWEIVDKTMGCYDRIEIPYGRNEKEFWEAFRLILEDLREKLSEGDRIYFDITHSFRSIPVFSLVITNLMKFLKGIKIEGMFYGMYDEKNDINPIVDMKVLLEINNLTEALLSFKLYGDTKPVSMSFESFYESLNIDEKKKYSWIKSITNILNVLNNAYQTNAVEVYFKKLKDLQEVLHETSKDLQEVLHNTSDHFYTLALMIQEFRRLIEESLNEQNDKRASKYLHMARKYYENGRLNQTVIVLRECFNIWILEACGCCVDKLDKEKIDKVIGILDNYGRRKMSECEEVKIASKLTDTRNKISHAFVGREVDNVEKEIKDIPSTIKNLLDAVSQLLHKDNVDGKICEKIKEEICGTEEG